MSDLNLVPNEILCAIYQNISNVYDIVNLIDIHKKDESKLELIKLSIKYVVFSKYDTLSKTNTYICYNEYLRLTDIINNHLKNYNYDLHLDYDVEYEREKDHRESQIRSRNPRPSLTKYFHNIKTIISYPNLINYDMKIQAKGNNFLELMAKKLHRKLQKTSKQHDVKFQILRDFFCYTNKSYGICLSMEKSEYYDYLKDVPIETLVGSYNYLPKLPIKHLVLISSDLELFDLLHILDTNIKANPETNGTIESISSKEDTEKYDFFVNTNELIRLYTVTDDEDSVVDIDEIEPENTFDHEGNFYGSSNCNITINDINYTFVPKVYPNIKVFSQPIPYEYRLTFLQSFPNVTEWNLLYNKNSETGYEDWIQDQYKSCPNVKFNINLVSRPNYGDICRNEYSSDSEDEEIGDLDEE